MEFFVFEARLGDGEWMTCPFAPELEAKASEVVEYMNRIDPSFQYRAVPLTDRSVEAEVQSKAVVVSFPEFHWLLGALADGIERRRFAIESFKRRGWSDIVGDEEAGLEVLVGFYDRLVGRNEEGAKSAH